MMLAEEWWAPEWLQETTLSADGDDECTTPGKSQGAHQCSAPTFGFSRWHWDLPWPPNIRLPPGENIMADGKSQAGEADGGPITSRQTRRPHYQSRGPV